ncbi:myb-binding protein 1A [Musca domestica]|uniref:Myb-binding protein 1A-like protein n=1 Tax=Musca domestica TaxID=7370 RepID=A0A1I8N6X7_MUSDO|nr:myb-binding protein 1A [Musca domestica]
MNLSNKMKVKKDKKAEKRPQNGDETQEETASALKAKKKQKLSKEIANNEDGELEAPPAKTKAAIKTLDTNIFKYFKDLTSDEEKLRLEAAVQLLQQLNRNKDDDKKQKELQYSLKRLIRGCGSSTNASRSGFYVGLVGVLKSFSADEVPLQLVLDIMNKELHVGSAVVNKEDADAVVGKILVIGALLHSGRLADVNPEHLEQITNTLLQSTRHKTYHASLGYSFLCEIIETLSQEQFESAVWPLVQKELCRPWTKQNLQTIHCIIVLQKKFPTVLNAKFLKAHFGGAELLNSESFQYLHKIFWVHSNTDILTHPAFEYFGAYIATSKNLTTFWRETVDAGLENPTKLVEIETLKILTDIMDNLDVTKTKVHDLLGKNFMQMLIEGLKNLKQKKDETLKAFYGDFLESLVKCCGKITQDGDKVAIIQRLILPPGTFNIEKFTGNRIVHQLINTLGEEGVKEIFKLYKSIFLGTLAKNPENSSETWLNFERLNAGYMLQYLLQHKSVHNAYAWREEQLKFLFTCGVFYVTDLAEICKKETAGSFSKDFADQCKNMFFTCLQTKLHDIDEEQKLLYNLAQYCQEKLAQKQANKCIRITKFDEALQKAWRSMYEAVSEGQNNKKKASKDNKLQSVFNILLLNMGLQLFREPEMAAPAVEDLLKCMAKTKEAGKNKKKSKKSLEGGEGGEEPEWIEVVVDLFLHLLSQNNGALRNIVNALFPHLCDNLTLTAVHQILGVLDMKDGQNPLTGKDEEEEDDDEDDDDDDSENEEEQKPKANGKNKQKSEEDDEDSDDDGEEDEDDEEDDDEDDDEEEEEDDEEGITEIDKLRNAVSQALIASGTQVDDDMESVDLNDMTEEEGRKLDEALANAFKAMKKTGSSQTKKSKSYRVKTTTVMHFRIRVLDLLEIYLQHKPSLLISIEIMLALYNMLEYCVGDELKPLQSKVEKTLLKLTALKNYTNTDKDLKEENFVDFLRLVIDKKAPAPVFEIVNKMRNKCCCFLIGNAYKINANGQTHKILALCREYVQEFVKSRNPTINITLLSDIFKLRWCHNYDLAEDLTQQGINLEARTFRRIQVYEILSILYKNNELQKQNEDETKKRFKKIEKTLKAHIQALTQNKSLKQSPKEFQTLLELIINVQKAHQRLGTSSLLTTDETLSSLQNLRKLIRLESTHVYQRFCGAFKLNVIRNTEVQQKENGEGEKESSSESEGSASSADDDDEEEEEEQNNTANGKHTNESKKSAATAQKRKQQTANDSRKLKKQKKLQRLEAASKGLNGGIGFSQQNGNDSDSS